MAEVASAPVDRRGASSRGRLRVTPWRLAVAVSVLVVAGGAAAFGAAWLATGRTSTSSYRVGGKLAGVQIRVASGDVIVVGGAQGGVEVRRADRSTFGHGPIEWRRTTLGRLEIASACPKLVVGACSASYRVAVPDNVPVSVRVDRGTIRVDGYRGSASLATGGGAIAVDDFCGYVLRAISAGGDVTAAASCSPQRLELRTTSGSVAATVPAGRYRIDASSGSGSAVVRGLTSDANAPWEIQALSTRGDVTIEAAS